MIEIYSTKKHSNLEEREDFLNSLHSRDIQNAVLLSTCNRVEIYRGQGEASENVTRHLFRTAAGLESNLVGEIAIISQLKQAYKEATERDKLDRGLHQLFQTSFFVGKRVRHETGISKGAMSHGQAAVNTILKYFPDTSQEINIVLIGVNKINESIVRFLHKKEMSPISVSNRTYEKAERFAEKWGDQAFHFSGLFDKLKNADVLISCTSAPYEIISSSQIPREQSLLVLDLAVPHDVDKTVKLFSNITYFSVEDIERQVEQNILKRKKSIDDAERIVEEEVRYYLRKQEAERNYLSSK